MLKRNAIMMSAALSVSLALPLTAQETGTTAPAEDVVEKIDVTGDTVLATVNGENITVAHAIAAKATLPEQFQTMPNDVLLPGIVEQLIQQTVLGQAIGEVTRRTEIQLENQRRQILATEMIDDVISEAVTDDALQAAFNAEYANAEPVPEFNASHILVETEEQVKELITQLESGADFAEMAKEHSTGPSGPNGGELGWFGPGMMVKPFEDAVQTLEPGDISGPVETQFGWHVVKLNDKRVQDAPVMEDVRQELAEKIENDAVESALQKLLDAAKIDRIELESIDPEMLNDETLLD